MIKRDLLVHYLVYNIILISNFGESLNLFSQFGIDTNFLQYDPTTILISFSIFIYGKVSINYLKIIKDTSERIVKLMKDNNETLTLDEEEKQYKLQCQAYKKI